MAGVAQITSIIVLRGRRGTDGTRGTLRGRRGTNSHLPSFCVAGVAQTHIYRRLAWQAWHKLTSILSSFCVAGVALMALGGALGLGLVARDAAALCVAGVHKLTSTVVLRGRRGTNSHLPSSCMAGVAQTHIYHGFACRRGTDGTGWRLVLV